MVGTLSGPVDAEGCTGKQTPMTAYDSLLDAVGGTPLIRLNRVTAGLAPTVYVKLEYLNPGGSVKDRAARWMVLEAVRTGALRAGGTIVEGTSGNTGIGLAQAAAQLGFPFVVVVPDKTAAEKISTLRAYGARVVVTGSGYPREHPRVPCGRSRTGSPTRSRAAGWPTSTTTPTTPARTASRPARRSGPTPPAGSRTSWRASGRAARSPGPRSTSRRSAAAG